MTGSSCTQERGEVEREILFVLCKLLNGFCLCWMHSSGVRGSVVVKERNMIFKSTYFSRASLLDAAFLLFAIRKHCEGSFLLIASQKN